MQEFTPTLIENTACSRLRDSEWKKYEKVPEENEQVLEHDLDGLGGRHYQWSNGGCHGEDEVSDGASHDVVEGQERGEAAEDGRPQRVDGRHHRRHFDSWMSTTELSSLNSDHFRHLRILRRKRHNITSHWTGLNGSQRHLHAMTLLQTLHVFDVIFIIIHL